MYIGGFNMKKAAVYTRTGDKGSTSLLTGERVPKQSLRVEAYGNIDEVRAELGLARATVVREDVKETIFKIQELLMSLMADVASLNLQESYIKPEHVTFFEQTIDQYDAMLAPLTHFITPGDNLGAAALDMARTTTRRAERALLRVTENEEVNNNVLLCLNRLSDLCFILLRVETEVK
jgi:cob(I)alamin adenosyltransferase